MGVAEQQRGRLPGHQRGRAGTVGGFGGSGLQRDRLLVLLPREHPRGRVAQRPGLALLVEAVKGHPRDSVERLGEEMMQLEHPRGLPQTDLPELLPPGVLAVVGVVAAAVHPRG